MNSQSAQTLLDSIIQTIHDIDRVSGTDALIDSFLAKFLVVYICGVYEEVVENIFVDFISRNSPRSEVVSYARETIDKSFRNPDSAKLIELISRLGNVRWTETIRNMKNERLALDNIVTNKNSIAHGSASTITLRDVKSYYNDSLPLIEKIDSLFV